MKIYLQKIIDLLGGKQQQLADVLATENDPIKQGHVWNWLNVTIDGIPEKHVIDACAAVGYQVTPHQLRPDIYRHPDDGLPDEMRCVCKDKAA
jgi:uncharacterized membrane protein YkvA (DUF1232 family)